MTGFPLELGFFFPAEWHPHRATWLSWPHNPQTWPDVNTILPAYVQFVEILSRSEDVCINVVDEAMRANVRDLLAAAGCRMDAIRLYVHRTDDCWIRDNGPSVLIHRSEPGRRVLIDWEFNAWGGKYEPYDNDNRLPSLMARALGLELITPGIVLEGGSVEFNGSGTVIVTESCLLNPNRNPTLDRSGVEQALARYFGVSNILWLGEGIVGDDTDGHVDDITRFVNERTVVTAVEADRGRDNWRPLEDNASALRSMRLEDGSPLEIIEIPMPDPVVRNGVRLPASYVNFYVANGAVIVPVFGDRHDDTALRVIEQAFPDRVVHGIEATGLVWGLGAFHCLSQQEPMPR